MREDAKRLYKSILCGEEKRIRLIQYRSSIQNKLLQEACVVVWAIGYKSVAIPIYDDTGKRISLKVDAGRIQVDDRSRIISTKGLPLF